MEATSPYQSPETQSEMAQQPAYRSTIPKTFGIIHIVYAILGSGFGLMGVVTVFAMQKLVELSGDKNLELMVDAMGAYTPYMIADGVVKLALGVLLIIAGIKLIKYRHAGVKMTKVWAVIRIIWAVVFPVVSYGAMVEYQAVVAEMQKSGGGMAMPMQGQAFMIIQLVIGIAMVCVYPVLSVMFLKKVDVQRSLS